MKNKFLLAVLSVITLSMLFMTGCQKKVTVGEDLTNFDQKVSNMISTFQSDVKKIGTISNLDSIKKANVLSKKLLKKVKAVDVKTEEVKSLHKLLVSGIDDVVECMNILIEATEKKDQGLFNKVNEKSEQSVKKFNKFFDSAKVLAKKEGIKLKTKNFMVP